MSSLPDPHGRPYVNEDPGGGAVDVMHGALSAQSKACAALGSPMYAGLLGALAFDYSRGGPLRSLLEGRSDRPVHDALPLRLVAALHRIVLEGRAPRLARHYPSAGGSPTEDLPRDFLAAMEDHAEEVEAGLGLQVQTNETGRSVVPLALSHWLTDLGVTAYAHLEIGASAGLNLNFDRYFASTPGMEMGDPSSAVRFGPEWFDGAPEIPRSAAVPLARHGSDLFTVDLGDESQRTRLRSYVWPDHVERHARISAAIAVAGLHPPDVVRASAEEWLARVLPEYSDVPVLVFHSIVWQYLGREVQGAIRDTLASHGSRRDPWSPLVWARMEPAGEQAAVTATVWGGAEPHTEVLAAIGYHGQGMRWSGGQRVR